MLFTSAGEARAHGPLALRALVDLGPDDGLRACGRCARLVPVPGPGCPEHPDAGVRLGRGVTFAPPARFFVGRLAVLELAGPVAIGGVWTVDQVEAVEWPR